MGRADGPCGCKAWSAKALIRGLQEIAVGRSPAVALGRWVWGGERQQEVRTR